MCATLTRRQLATVRAWRRSRWQRLALLRNLAAGFLCWFRISWAGEARRLSVLFAQACLHPRMAPAATAAACHDGCLTRRGDL